MATLQIPDIKKRIALDFGERTTEANALLDDAINRADYLATPRIIRCILYLSNGDIEKLRKNIEVATFDPRDVMARAEYENPDEMDFDEPQDPVRNFNDTFEENSE